LILRWHLKKKKFIGGKGHATMSVHQDRLFLHRFTLQLEVSAAWLHHEPPCAMWLDAHRRINSATIADYAVGMPLRRLSINNRPVTAFKDRTGWPELIGISPARPEWRLEIICLEAEVGPFANWLAQVVNRRVGVLERLPAPPCALLNWGDDLERLDDYLHYLSSVSLWSERAFQEDLKWLRQPASVFIAPGSLAAAAAR
jgi:hypothetical protein